MRNSTWKALNRFPPYNRASRGAPMLCDPQFCWIRDRGTWSAPVEVMLPMLPKCEESVEGPWLPLTGSASGPSRLRLLMCCCLCSLTSKRVFQVWIASCEKVTSMLTTPGREAFRVSRCAGGCHSASDSEFPLQSAESVYKELRLEQLFVRH